MLFDSSVRAVDLQILRERKEIHAQAIKSRYTVTDTNYSNTRPIACRYPETNAWLSTSKRQASNLTDPSLASPGDWHGASPSIVALCGGAVGSTWNETKAEWSKSHLWTCP